MTSYLRRLLRTGAAYQLADAVSKVVALALLPVYTNHLTPADYGTAELLLTTIILVSIVLRLGLGEALVRFHFDDADPERRRALARTATGTLFIATTAGGARWPRCSPARSATRCWTPTSPGVIRAAALGLWAFTNLELAYALLRVEERARAFATASLINVALTVAPDRLPRGHPRTAGAIGLLLGNYIASAVVLVGLWWTEREAFGFRPRRDRPRAPRPDAALRPADGPRRGQRLRPVLHRPLLAVPVRERRRGGPVLAQRQARRHRRLHGARVPVRLAAARLQHRVRRGGQPRLRPHHDLLRALHGDRRRRPGPARPLAGADLRRSRVLRRP